MKKSFIALCLACCLIISIPVFSQTCTITLYYSGAQAWGCCNACGTDYVCYGGNCGCCQNAQQTKTFFDPLPSGAILTDIQVTYYGADAGVPAIATFIDSVPVCSAILTYGISSSACGACNHISCSAAGFPTGFPGYVYGGLNILYSEPSSGFVVCLQRVEIMLTYHAFLIDTISGPAALCQGESSVYSIDSVYGATSYLWSVPGNTQIISGQGTTTVNLTAGDTSGVICITAANGSGDTAQFCIPLTIKPNPLVASTPAFVGVCIGDSVQLMACGADFYSWSPATGLSATNYCCVMASPADTTIYVVTGTTDGCTATDATVVFAYDCSSVPENENIDDENIYPNPYLYSGLLHWQGNYDEIEITDIFGRIVEKAIITDERKSYSPGNSIFSEGIYFVRLKRNFEVKLTVRVLFVRP